MIMRGLIVTCALAYGAFILPHFHYGEAIGMHAGCIAALAGAWALAGARRRLLTLRLALAGLATAASLLAGVNHVVYGARAVEAETDRLVDERLGRPVRDPRVALDDDDDFDRAAGDRGARSRLRSLVQARGRGWGRACAVLNGTPVDAAGQPPRVFCGESHLMFLGRHDAFEHARDRREAERRCRARAEELRARILNAAEESPAGSR